MTSNPVKIGFPSNVNCCDNTISVTNKIACTDTIKNQFKTLENSNQFTSGALYVFYKGNDFTGQPIGYKYKDNISIVDTDSPPDVKDNFCCRIICYLSVPQDNNYQFQIGADDGARVFINNKIIINNFDSYWNKTLSSNTTSDKFKLYKDFPYLLVIEFTEDKGLATLDFKYLNNTTSKYENIPSSWISPFKPYSDTYNSYENSMNKYCSKLDTNKNKDLCKNYLINNPATNLVKSIIDYCNTGDNQKTDYCNIPTQDAINIQKKNIGNKEFENEIKKKYNLNLVKSLQENKQKYIIKKLKESNYNDKFSIDFILNEVIPLHLILNNNDINKIYNILFTTTNSLNVDELIQYVEKNDPELTNIFIKKIYDMFKNIDNNPIRNSWIKLMSGNCAKLNKDNQLKYQVEKSCLDFLKTNTELNKTVLDFCNSDNIHGKYCTDLDNLVITNKINKLELPINNDLATALSKQRMDLNKQKLIDSKYTDQNAINYFNNQFKQLVDLEKSTSANLYNTYVLTPDALNYCEDNYLDTDNKFCKPTLNTYSNQQNVNKAIDKIKEQSCLYNNNFVTDKNCNDYSSKTENYNKFIKANNNYCSTNDNIATEYCQSYYKNVENQLTNQIQSENCSKSSTFKNNETFENNETSESNIKPQSDILSQIIEYKYILIFIFFIIIAILLGTDYNSSKYNRQKNNRYNRYDRY